MVNKARTKTIRKNNSKLLVWVFVVLFILIVLSVTLIIVLNNKEIFGVDESSIVTNETQYVITHDIQDSGDENDDAVPIKIYDVYYHDGENVTGMKSYYKFKNEGAAKKAFSLEEMQEYRDNGYLAALSGQFIVLTADKSIYEGETLESVKYWNELYQNETQLNEDDVNNQGAVEGETDNYEMITEDAAILEPAE